MRGLVVDEFGPFENVVAGDRPEPSVGPDDILVDVRATSVNFADTLLVTGAYQFKPALPFIPGKSPSGLVLRTGEAVKGFKAGDRVLTLAETGGFAERVAVKATHCFHLPPGMSFESAASMASVCDTAWIALRERGLMRAGESVLILGGSSGIGLAAAQLAKAFGGFVMSAIANPAKAELVRSAGADVVIDCSEAALTSQLRDAVMAATGGAGADVVVDVLGGDVFDAAIRAVAWNGRAVVVGFAAGRIQSIRANYLLVKNISVAGMQISDYHRRRPETTALCWQDIFSLFSAGLLKPPPTVVWPLTRCVEALRALRDRTAPGRIVLQQGDP